MGPPTGASGGRDATASWDSRAGRESVEVLTLVEGLDDAPLRSGSGAVDGPMTIALCGGLGALWAGGEGSSAVTSRGGGSAGEATDPSVTGTGSCRGSIGRGSTIGRGADRGRGVAATGAGCGGVGESADSRSSHATRGALSGTRAAEPATTTIVARPR